jgi:hypothetical protein
VAQIDVGFLVGFVRAAARKENATGKQIQKCSTDNHRWRPLLHDDARTSAAHDAGGKNLQTVQGQVGIDRVDELGFLADECGLPAGANDSGFGA